MSIKYGMKWGTDDPIVIEQEMIRRGGQWKDAKGNSYGLGLFQHFKNYWSLLWPNDSQTRWTDLILQTILKHQFISIIGPASSWKTGTVSRIALMDWSVFPECTTILQSSTDMEGLRSRIFGETSKIWASAHEHYEDFPGNVIDHKCVIANDNIDEDAVRDIRNGIIGVACKSSSGTFLGMGKYCFSKGTQVDTPNGKIPIESIKDGDVVNSAIGPRRVTGCSSHIADELVKIHMSNGITIQCTADHPFLTTSGWQNALYLSPQTQLLSTHETLCIMREGIKTRRLVKELLRQAVSALHKTPSAPMRWMHEDFESKVSEILQRRLPANELGEEVSRLRGEVYSIGKAGDFLYSLLCSEMEDEAAGDCSTHERQSRHDCGRFGYKQVYHGESKGTGAKATEYETPFTYGQDCSKIERLWCGAQKGAVRANSCCHVSRGEIQFSSKDRSFLKAWERRTLLFGLRLAAHQAGRGDRWVLPQWRRAKGKGRGTNCFSKSPRVVRVEVLKHRSQRQSNQSEENYRVYNIEVEGHPSYSVNNCVVHNSGRKNRRVWCIGDEFQFMERAILDAQNNLISNGPNLVAGTIEDGHEKGQPKRGYKAVFIGNPNPTRPENPLHLISEPIGGWSSFVDDEKTKVWQCIKVPDSCVQCVCINLDGADSPNNDFEKPKWVNLISKDRLAMYDKDGEPYWTQGRGIVKLGIAGKKIITPELCRAFKASEDVIWDGTPRTKIGGVDAAYGGVGGDRCAVGWVEFGKCVDGKNRILFHSVLFPTIVLGGALPEDQIAIYVKDRMEEVGVAPENFFFDARGSMAISFARIWSPAVNAIEFGGNPSKRIVGPDVFFVDEKGNRRLKTADEHYSKFVTELWFSLRYAIESDQVRGLGNDTIMDAYPREWEKVKGDKLEAESKKLMKKRTGRSPDLGDLASILLEGARRRGFVIAKLATVEEKADSNKWLDELRKKATVRRELGQLTYK